MWSNGSRALLTCRSGIRYLITLHGNLCIPHQKAWNSLETWSTDSIMTMVILTGHSQCRGLCQKWIAMPLTRGTKWCELQARDANAFPCHVHVRPPALLASAFTLQLVHKCESFRQVYKFLYINGIGLKDFEVNKKRNCWKHACVYPVLCVPTVRRFSFLHCILLYPTPGIRSPSNNLCDHV